MRKYCLDCVIKHLAQAFVLQMEVAMGYSDHLLLVFGHLAEASEECFGVSPELAEEIRQNRLAVMENPSYEIPYFDLYKKVKKLIKEKGCGDCQKAKTDFLEKIKQKKEENERNK